MPDIVFRPIGTVFTPFDRLEGMPIQPTGTTSAQGRIELLPELAEGLTDLEGFSHLILLYHLHQVKDSSLIVKPYLDDRPHGIFATRSPARPNPIGLSVVRFLSREGATVHIDQVDMLNGTPLLDIKPSVPEFDHHPVERTGWIGRSCRKVQDTLSDSRFVDLP